MSKITSHQRMIRCKQPYTRIAATFVPRVEQSEEEGAPPKITFEDTHLVYGYTYEEQLVASEDDDGEPTYELRWTEHDLGAAVALTDAHELAANWRGSLVGQYPVR